LCNAEGQLSVKENGIVKQRPQTSPSRQVPSGKRSPNNLTMLMLLGGKKGNL